jgi:bacteriocin-like protein
VEEFCEAEMSIEELDQVSGGDMLGMAIDAAENYMNGLFGRLINAVHQPITSSPSMSLHMR